MNPAAGDEPRIPPLASEHWDTATAEMIERTRVGTFHPSGLLATFAHNDSLLKRWAPLGSRLVYRSQLSHRLRELIILRTAWNTGCDYEWQSHSLGANQAGISDTELRRLKRPDPLQWPAAEFAVIQAADELYESAHLSDDVWALLEANYEPGVIIEILILIGNYTMMSYLINGARISSGQSA